MQFKWKKKPQPNTPPNIHVGSSSAKHKTTQIVKTSPKRHQHQSQKKPRRLFPQPDMGDPDRQRFTRSLVPGGLTLPAASTFSSPASIPAGMGWKITGSFLSEQMHSTASSSIDKRAKENKISHCHLKIASVKIPRRVLSANRDWRLIREGYQHTWCWIKPDPAARHSHSIGQIVDLQWTPEKL